MVSIDCQRQSDIAGRMSGITAALAKSGLSWQWQPAGYAEVFSLSSMLVTGMRFKEDQFAVENATRVVRAWFNSKRFLPVEL